MFDIDGVLADATHRQDVLFSGPGRRKNWKAFFELAGDDAAITAFSATTMRDERTRSNVYATTETVLASFADPSKNVRITRCNADFRAAERGTVGRNKYRNPSSTWRTSPLRSSTRRMRSAGPGPRIKY